MVFVCCRNCFCVCVMILVLRLVNLLCVSGSWVDEWGDVGVLWSVVVWRVVC